MRRIAPACPITLAPKPALDRTWRNAASSWRIPRTTDRLEVPGVTGRSVRVLNVHQRSLRASPAQAARLLDGLSSPQDPLWPSEAWPRMRFDRPIQPGALGGHGPIRYAVASYDPGQRITFRFTAPRGFVGQHWFEVLPEGTSGTLLRHTIRMTLTGSALLSWPLVYRPLHDALVEDALTKAQVTLGEQPARVRWSPWVRLLRRALTRRSRRAR